MLVKGEQRPQPRRIDMIEQYRGRGAIALIGPGRIGIGLAGHQRRALREAIDQKRAMMPFVKPKVVGNDGTVA